mgnify:CR=1 FL=1
MRWRNKPINRKKMSKWKKKMLMRNNNKMEELIASRSGWRTMMRSRHLWQICQYSNSFKKKKTKCLKYGPMTTKTLSKTKTFRPLEG